MSTSQRAVQFYTADLQPVEDLSQEVIRQV